MSDVLTISSQKPEQIAFDYEALKNIGVRHIEQTASALWTDYNIHDPGITILELLCYVITDLSYRSNNSIPNLLATPTDTKTNILQHFISAARIFPNKPVTITDYRKLIIDIEGIKNAWLVKKTVPIVADITHKKLQFTPPQTGKWEPVSVQGYYDILLEFDTNVTDEQKQIIKQNTRNIALENRNLCENFLGIDEISKQQFRICVELELKPEADPFDAVAQILFNIQLYLTPLIKFYWLKELLDEGYKADAIFEGPLLTHGFIKEEELLSSDLKTEVHLSDIMQQILNVVGIDNIIDIIFNPTDQVKELPNKWIVPIASGKQPVLNV
ncbi:MAG: diguanylate cyclase, partial [Sphingobacteriales bacterium]